MACDSTQISQRKKRNPGELPQAKSQQNVSGQSRQIRRNASRVAHSSRHRELRDSRLGERSFMKNAPKECCSRAGCAPRRSTRRILGAASCVAVLYDTLIKVRLGETPKPALETSALPGIRTNPCA